MSDATLRSKVILGTTQNKIKNHQVKRGSVVYIIWRHYQQLSKEQTNDEDLIIVSSVSLFYVVRFFLICPLS